MTSEIKYIYRLHGQYIGFISDGGIFAWDGRYLGWIEDGYAWDKLGQFKGKLTTVNGSNYILKDILAVPPIPKQPKLDVPILSNIPAPQLSIPAITAPRLGLVDGF